MKRQLTDIEERFVKEAQEGYFLVGFDENDGSPYAMGAPATDNLFSMDVTEEPDGRDAAIYYLSRPEANEEF